MGGVAVDVEAGGFAAAFAATGFFVGVGIAPIPLSHILLPHSPPPHPPTHRIRIRQSHFRNRRLPHTIILPRDLQLLPVTILRLLFFLRMH